MLARPYKREDAKNADRLLGDNAAGCVELAKDNIIVSGDPLAGILVYRPGAWVHELRVEGMLRLPRAQEIVSYATGRALVQGLHAAIFTVAEDNVAMQKFVESCGAIKQNGKILYVLHL